jgi:Protein of unknown function (DUF4239)
MVVAVAAAVGGLHLVRRQVPHDVREKNNEVAGFFIAVLGVIYGVLLAFVVVAAWESFRDTQRTVEREANELVDIARVSQGLAEPTARRVHELAAEYAQLAIDAEWPAMSQGRRAEDQEAVLAEMWTAFRGLDATASDDVIRARFLEHFSALSDARLARQIEATEGLPGAVWLILVGGAFVTILFTYFFSAPNPMAQYVMTGLFAASIVLVLGLVSLLDFPLRGDLAIEPDAFEFALRTLERLRQ